ncbi:MAG: cysteine hydrolase family protein [Balneolaceae bacterium]|jgi:nicotinamidase-related amidase
MKKALLIIDIQHDYFRNGKMELVGPEIAAGKAKLILEDFRGKGLPVFHIQHVSTRPGAAFFLPETKGVQIYDTVKPVEGEQLITKNYPNSFRETSLLEKLKNHDITDLVMLGMMTHMCVDSTVRAAKDYGFNCTVIGDACATKDLMINGEQVAAGEVQKSFLSALNYFYSTVLNAQAYLKQEEEC